jgi:hypothetical protein
MMQKESKNDTPAAKNLKLLPMIAQTRKKGKNAGEAGAEAKVAESEKADDTEKPVDNEKKLARGSKT